MRRLFSLACLSALALTAYPVRAAEVVDGGDQAFIHLFPDAPEGGRAATYDFSFLVPGGVYETGRVTFVGSDGREHSFGVGPTAQGKYIGGGVTLALVGVPNGIVGSIGPTDPQKPVQLPRLSFSSPRSDNASPLSMFAAEISEPQLIAAVPEPATWGMMLLGFGFIGGAMRSAKRRQKLPSAVA